MHNREPTDEKLIELWNRWQYRGDSVGKRLLASIFSRYQHLDKVIETVLNDDEEIFKNLINKDKLNISYWLEVACLCNAENIVNLLISHITFSSLEETNEAIGYALSTGNYQLAKKVASVFKEIGKTNPGDIYLYNGCKYSEAKKIETMFHPREIVATS